jgi:hypothetical protein
MLGLLSPELAAGIRRVKGVRRLGTRGADRKRPNPTRLGKQTAGGTPALVEQVRRTGAQTAGCGSLLANEAAAAELKFWTGAGDERVIDEHRGQIVTQLAD